MKKLNDYDLDVMNALEGFPEDNENSFLYIRGSKNNEKINSGFVHIKSTNETLPTMIYSLIKKDESAKLAVFNAVLNVLNSSKSDQKIFLDALIQCN